MTVHHIDERRRQRPREIEDALLLPHRERCYLGTRTHPTAGLLLKVGVSSRPKRRARQLGIELHALLPRRCEIELHRMLRFKRVWRDEVDLTWAGGKLLPVFPAHTEWFYTDPALGEWLRKYVTFAWHTEVLLHDGDSRRRDSRRR